jgi:hypothetical protein
MNSNKVSRSNDMMTKADSQFQFAQPVSRGALLAVSAVLLILLGFVLQLNMLGYGHFDSNNFWCIPVVLEGIWNIVATPMDMPTMQELLRFWPLLIVCSGMMMLLSLRPARLARVASDSETKGRQDA